MHRKPSYPVYDSEAACLVLLAAMLVTFWFGVIGYRVAEAFFPGKGHIWVPIFLMGASAFVIVSVTFRLIRRYLRQREQASLRH